MQGPGMTGQTLERRHLFPLSPEVSTLLLGSLVFCCDGGGSRSFGGFVRYLLLLWQTCSLPLPQKHF